MTCYELARYPQVTKPIPVPCRKAAIWTPAQMDLLQTAEDAGKWELGDG